MYANDGRAQARQPSGTPLRFARTTWRFPRKRVPAPSGEHQDGADVGERARARARAIRAHHHPWAPPPHKRARSARASTITSDAVCSARVYVRERRRRSLQIVISISISEITISDGGSRRACHVAAGGAWGHLVPTACRMPIYACITRPALSLYLNMRRASTIRVQSDSNITPVFPAFGKRGCGARHYSYTSTRTNDRARRDGWV